MKNQTLEHAFEHDPSVAEFAVSKHALLGRHKDAPYALIATSALVVDTRGTSSPRILLLQRAASDSHPNKWEPPGGAVDDDDATILHAVARELVEETSLKAARIGGPVGESQPFKRSNGDTVCRFSFAVHVDAGKEDGLVVQLDLNEHQSFVWATEDEVRAGKAGDVKLNFVPGEVKQTVLQAFKHT
jgi:8-oxo-dGTP pyrophosphatase MutT (NUDIX family)